MSFKSQLLASRAVIAISGAEALRFLQNLVTVQLDGLALNEARYGALLSPQGKILHDFFIFCEGDTLLLDCALSQREALLKRLQLYRLRAAITIVPRTDLAVVVSSEPLALALSYSDPRLAELGWRGFVLAGAGYQLGLGYERARISAGLADSDADLGSEQIYPHEANFDQLGAVSFTKGCYIGQEVVSRMQHRSTARQRILPVKFSGEAAPPQTEISSGELRIGEMLSHEQEMGLALLRLDRLAEAQAPLLCAGQELKVIKPEWLTYPVIIGESA